MSNIETNKIVSYINEDTYGEDFKNKVLAFRSYLVSEFPNFIANYNSKKSK
jgi:hypothetical protein